MAENEVKLMKGNEVIAHAAIRYGCDGYFGYPITPQSEVMETLMELKPWETTGMVVLQAESEISSINMVYGGASTGKRVMTSAFPVILWLSSLPSQHFLSFGNFADYITQSVSEIIHNLSHR